MSDLKTSSEPVAHRAISGAGVQIALQLVGQILALFVTRALLSSFSIEENGVFAFIQKTGTLLFTLFVDAGMVGLTIRYSVDSPNDTGEIVSTLLKLRLGLWVIVSFFLVGGGAVFAADYTMPLLWWSLFFLFSSKVGLLRTALETVYRRQAQFVFISLLSILETAVFILLLLIGIKDMSVSTVMLFYLLSSLPSFIILFVKTNGWAILAVPFSKRRAQQLFHDILPFAGATVLFYLNSYSEILFLSLLGSIAYVGIFEAIGRIVIPMFMVIGALSNAIYPFIVQFQKEDIERCKHYVFYGYKFTVIISSLIATGMIAIAPWIIQFFTGGTYAANTGEFVLYVWLIVPNFALTYVLGICLALGLQKKTIRIALFITIPSLLLDPVFIPLWGVAGAIWVKLFSNIVAGVVVVQILNDFLQDNRLNSFLLRFIPAWLVVLGCASWFLYLLPMWQSLPLVLAIFVFLITVARIIGKADVQLLYSFVVALQHKLGLQRK